MATLGDLLFVVERKSGLNSTVADELTLMTKWANDGVVEVLLETHCVKTIGDLALQIGVDSYITDASILAVSSSRITSLNQRYDMEVVNYEELQSRQRVQSTSPVQMVAFEGDMMFVYPTPTVADVIRFLYVPRPPSKLTTNADDLSATQFGRMPSEYHRAVEYYMLWQAAEFDDKKFAETPNDLFKQFEMECAKARKRAHQKRGRAPRKSSVGYPGRTGNAKRNDQDIVY